MAVTVRILRSGSTETVHLGARPQGSDLDQQARELFAPVKQMSEESAARSQRNRDRIQDRRLKSSVAR